MDKQKSLIIIVRSLGQVVFVACLVFGLAWGMVGIAHFREKHSCKETPPQLTISRHDLPESLFSLLHLTPPRFPAKQTELPFSMKRHIMFPCGSLVMVERSSHLD